MRSNSWSEEELARLRAGCDAGLSSQEIADELGRSRQAVNFRVHALGIPRPRKRRFDHLARFWERVQQGSEEECWPWTGARHGGGYGLIWTGRTQRAHRVAFELAHGAIPEGAEVAHLCDNPICCNPAHLLAVSHADNMRQMVERGRQAVGQANGRWKHGRRAKEVIGRRCQTPGT